MNRNYTYRLYPNRAQTALLARVIETHRQLYNAALQKRREAWQKCCVLRNYYDRANQLKAIRALDEDAAWLNYSSIQQTFRRLDKALAAFFRRIKVGGTPGYPRHPRYKGRKWFNTVEYRWEDGARLKPDRLHVQNVGAIKVKWHRAIPVDATIKCLYLKRQETLWYAVFSLELPNEECAPHPGPAVGLDLSLNALVALSDGPVVEAPRHFRAAESKPADARCLLSRRVKFSSRWKKQVWIVARQHHRIAKQRRDFAHKLARQLAETQSLIAVEDLNIAALSQSALAKSVEDVGWGQLLDLLTYKVESAGGQVVAVDPRQTSQRCSRYGATVLKDLSIRVPDYPACGLTLDRDVNAARNILMLGLATTTARTEPSALAPRSRGVSREAAAITRWSGHLNHQIPGARRQRTRAA